MSVPLSIDRQIRSMEETWPTLRLIHRDGPLAVWQGLLRPLFRLFEVRVTYRAPCVPETLDPRRDQPRVRVLDPPLRPRRGDPQGQLPHVYYVGDGPLDVVLCMFDPETNEWSPGMPLAETTVPWTVDWLASYEGWRATGKWTGGGRHVGDPVLGRMAT